VRGMIVIQLLPLTSKEEVTFCDLLSTFPMDGLFEVSSHLLDGFTVNHQESTIIKTYFPTSKLKIKTF
jgi:hypothetical protein